MKRIVTLFLCVVMLTSLMAVGSSAAGTILFEDDFSDMFSNPNNWILEGNNFFGDDLSEPGNPCLSTYADGVVSQMEFRPEMSNSAKIFKDCVISIDVALRDFDRDGDHSASLWWRENFLHTPEGESEPEGYEAGPIFNYGVDFDNSLVYLHKDGVDAHVFEAPVTGVEAGDGWFNLGWRIVAGRMDLYFNGEKIGEYADAEITCQRGSPFLLVNNGCYISFDNMVIATADYDMFNEGLGEVVTTEPTPTPTEGIVTTEPIGGGEDDPTPTETTTTETTTQIVEVTELDTDGNVVVKTEVITDAPVATNAPVPDTVVTTGTTGSSTSTGDAAFVVTVVMVITLGAAILVRKAYAE